MEFVGLGGMTVKELKDLLNEAPDDMLVLLSATGEFDGAWASPCNVESGVSELGFYDNEEDEKEAKLLNRPTTDKMFLLVRCGFFEAHDGPDPKMN